jgi:peptide/nickel transport system permease protein
VRLPRDKPATIALGGLGTILLVAVLAPVLTHTDPYDTTLAAALQPPGTAHWLGTDGQGHDMVTRLIYGTRLTLLMSLAAVLLGLVPGAVIGLFAAYYRRLEGVLMRAMDVLLSFPAILLGLSLAAILTPGAWPVMIALAVATVPLTARITYNAASVEMGRDYIEAARTVGMSEARLIWRHLAPNCAPCLLVFATLRLGQVILLGSVLSFLGLGPQPPAAELGAMAAQGSTVLLFAPRVEIAPCVTIFAIVLACNVLGDALRDTLPPRLRAPSSAERAQRFDIKRAL